MEAYLNEKDEDFFSSAENVAWSFNPLFDNNNKTDVSAYKNHNNNFNSMQDISPRVNVEFETESGYSETVLSELSSPNNSFSSNISYFDADEESEITDSMRKAKFLITSGADRDSLATNASSPQIVSAKGTVRGVKNRVRDNILHFLSDQSQIQQQDEDFTTVDPDHGKVIMYTTSLGLIRSTQDDCRYVKRMFHNLMVRVDERDLFVHPNFKQELQARLNGDEIRLPQVFVNGECIGGAKEVETLIETGMIKGYLEKVERVDPGESCPSCGGMRYLNCMKCSGSGKSRRTRISREISSLKCSLCTNGIVSCSECNS